MTTRAMQVSLTRNDCPQYADSCANSATLMEAARVRVVHYGNLTYSYSTGLLLMPRSGGAIHAAIFLSATILLAEILIANFRKIPFTCPYPQFESTSGLILVAYLFGFLLFTNYLPELEHWSLSDPLRAVIFIPLLAVGFAAIHIRRRQLLDMDKTLIFSES